MAKDSPHGTRQRYRSGCKCKACRKACSREVLERRKHDAVSRAKRARSSRRDYALNRDQRQAAQRKYRQSLRGRAIRAMHRHKRKGASLAEGSRGYAEVLLGDRCAYCNTAAEVVDHIHPIALGGNGEFTNLTAACRACNARKYAKPLLEFLLEPV